MTGTGKRKRGAGHFHRVKDDDSSPSFCGRTLGGGHFTDESEQPHICVPCLKALRKAENFDHHHLVFADGRWVVRAVRTPWFVIAGPYFTSAFTRCGLDGCNEMIRNKVVPMSLNVSTAGNTFIWQWAA